MKPVRVRFAPSPTGRMHLGSARTALYNYLFARQTGGQFIFRLEDTDRKRLVPGAENELIRGMHWLGLRWDEGPDVGGPCGPYRQSERREIYERYARQLVEAGHAYYCFCTSERLETVRQEQRTNKQSQLYDGACRNLDPREAAARVSNGERHVIRFKAPREGSITVRDLLRGDITVDNNTIDDFVLVKSDGFALYHLAAMVDDHLMEITHVIRGSEWLATFPLHVHLVRAFGWNEPEWVHLSVFLKPSGKGKMSKRESADLIKDGHSIFVGDLEQLGYIPEGVVNWIALMGWSYDDSTELFTLGDLVERFGLERLHPSPAAINFGKLDHFNGLHIRGLGFDDLGRRIAPFLARAGLTVDEKRLSQVTPLIRERLVTLDDSVPMAGFFFREDVRPTLPDLLGKTLTREQALDVARRSCGILAGMAEVDATTGEPALRALAHDMGLEAGRVFGVLRAAVTGQTVSPPLFESMAIVGREKVLERLRSAVAMIEAA